MTVQIERAGTAVTQITSVETVKAVARLTSSSGSPVAGVVVTFVEGSAGLLAFQPAAGTALTDADGKATLDVGAKASTSIGSTTVTATATVSGTSVTASQAISVGAAAATTPTSATIAFVGSSTSGQAIAIKGAGGSGRAEAAILAFKVLDSKGAPIAGAAVNFTANLQEAAGATFSPASAVSDSSGRVTTAVLSGFSAGSMVVVATAASSTNVAVQSDALLISNGAPVSPGFEIAAAKYNLDGALAGDATKITAYVRDQFGNPVPDGVAVSFQTDYGAVAASTMGGCTTVNGMCSVDFRVQEPRGTGLATVVATIGAGTSTVLQRSLSMHMPVPANSSLISKTTADMLTKVAMTSCKQTFEARLQDSTGYAMAAGTVVAVDSTSTGDLVATIKSGNPVMDALDLAPTAVAFEINATNASLGCNAAGTGQGTAEVTLSWTTPHGVKQPWLIEVTYPK
ncbi:hypothetical protein [Roseateles sp. BYS96W]|uniref:Big-1 domain-containing protein n=1 Tax=Pelomonas nitida TaxID=3299027 RepID=A0ABW7G049_9BURK